MPVHSVFSLLPSSTATHSKERIDYPLCFAVLWIPSNGVDSDGFRNWLKVRNWLAVIGQSFRQSNLCRSLDQRLTWLIYQPIPQPTNTQHKARFCEVSSLPLKESALVY